MTADAARAIEAVLMVAQDPVEPQLLAQLLEEPLTRVEELCQELATAYEADGRGFVLVRVAGGYRFQSHPDLAPYVERFVLEGQTAKLSSAALETLAIVAYKQPLSRAQVAAIRGVNVDGVMRTLQQRGYIAEVGRDSGPGQATLFGTTREFLERMGLDTIDELPPIHDLFPSADVMEALERSLLADPGDKATPEPVAEAAAPDPDAEASGDEAGAVPPSEADDTAPEPVAEAAPEVIDLDVVDLDALDPEDRPEPEPPSWAVDPEPEPEPDPEPGAEPTA